MISMLDYLSVRPWSFNVPDGGQMKLVYGIQMVGSDGSNDIGLDKPKRAT